MKIKGAIFDVDGTLLDSMFVWRRRGEIFLSTLGITARDDLHLDVRRLGFVNAPKMIKEEFSLSLSEAEISAGMMRVVEDFYKTDACVKSGTVEFLEELKKNNVKMCVATATDRYMVEPALEKCGIRNYFDEIFTCGELKTNKTKPDIFEKALLSLGTDKENTVIFEDALYAVKTAKQNGFFVTGVFDSEEPEQEEFRSLCDIFVHDLRDSLKNIL